MSAELQGLEDFRRKADKAATAVDAGARAVAAGSAHRVAAGIRARVRHAAQARMRAAVAVKEEAAAQQFVVGFDDAVLAATGLNPMIAVWHEFGTKYKSANPAVGDALSAERERYLNEMREAVTKPLEEASR